MSAIARPRRGRNPIAAEDAIAGWVFILPAVIIIGIFFFAPVLFSLWVSFRERDTLSTVNDFVGLDNYRHILTENRDFWKAFRNTTWFALIVVPLQTAIGLFLAVLANRNIRGKGFFRTAFYFPSISSSVVISIIFVWLYAKTGLLVFLMQKIGLDPPRRAWLADPRGVFELVSGQTLPTILEGPSVALVSIMMLNVWTTAGTMMVIFLAGLQDIPGDVYEAAALDGASRWKQFRDITVPLLRPVTLFVITLGLIGTFQVFDQIYVMSEGGPAKTTTTLAYLIYTEGFRFGEGLGYASALSIILFAIIFALFLIQRRFVGQTAAR
jgi:multiple sugar transport system permease protein